MNTPIRSANKAYYASKEPLLIRGTREGRKNPPPAPSYKQKANDVTARSDKYYRELGEQPGKAGQPPAQNAPAAVTGPPATIKAGPKVLQDVVAAFQRNASTIKVEGSPADINKARTAVELAVGRKTLTREQADKVSFIALIKEEPKDLSGVPEMSAQALEEMKQQAEQQAIDTMNQIAAGAEPEAEIKEEPKSETITNASDDPMIQEMMQAEDKKFLDSINHSEPEAEQQSEAESDAEIDAALNPPELKKEEKPKRKRRSRKKKKDDEITEADIASAFNVVDSDD